MKGKRRKRPGLGWHRDRRPPNIPRRSAANKLVGYKAKAKTQQKYCYKKTRPHMTQLTKLQPITNSLKKDQIPRAIKKQPSPCSKKEYNGRLDSKQDCKPTCEQATINVQTTMPH
nr:hypothetical protein [Tanacetum cinerariifolium]